MQILSDNLNHVKYFNSYGCLFFVSDLCAAIIEKDFQSSEDIFLFDLHRLDSALRLTCIEATIKYIFENYVKNFHVEPYDIQYVVIPLNFEDKKKQKKHCAKFTEKVSWDESVYKISTWA